MKMKNLILIILVLLILPINAKALDISSYEELKNAINNMESDIVLSNDLIFDSSIAIPNNITINGNNKTISRKEDYKGSLFAISSGGALELNNITIDGGAQNWTMNLENRHYTQADNKGYVRVPTTKSSSDNEATTSLIINSGSLLLNNVKIQNAACTQIGCAIRGTGNNTINNSSFSHIGSSSNGGALNLTGGTTTISNSVFSDNVAGYGIETSLYGGAIYVSGVTLLDISNSTFEKNLSQSNGGAVYVAKSNISIKDSIFKQNMSGNDGSAINLDNNTTTPYQVTIQDSTFDGNYGLATTGQSMGTIWIGSKWNNTVDNPLIFKNLVFKNNIARTGGALADNSSGTYLKFENIEVHNNEIGSGGFIYAQGSQYDIDGLYIHDNTGTSGSGLYVNGANVTINNGKISNNNSTSSGSGVYIIGGSLEISNSEISGNKSSGARGAGIFVRGYYDDYDPVLVLNNTVVKDNEAATMGGGICIYDNENIFSSITIDDSSKIYDNKAPDSGDDFVYIRENNSTNNTSNTVTLDNISIAGINGIDGWYHDNEGDRFLETENPSVFNNYVQYTGAGIYLKAAGISSYDYNLNGGENGEIIPIVIRYGQDYIVTDETPIKDGYEFIGWNTREDGTGINLKPGDKYDGSDGYVLYARYTVKVIEVPDTNKKTFYISLLGIFTLLISIAIIKIAKRKHLN